MELKSYPQVIHFLWKTVDKSIHRTNSKMNGVHRNQKARIPAPGKAEEREKILKNPQKQRKLCLTEHFFFYIIL